MPRRDARGPASESAFASADLYRFSHAAPRSHVSHFMKPTWRVYRPMGFDEIALTAASYWPADRRKLVFQVQHDGAVDFAQHRLVFNFRIPSQAIPEYSSAQHPLYNLIPATFSVAQPRLAHAAHLIRRLVVRDNTGSVVLDQDGLNVWNSARRWLDVPGEEPRASYGGSAATSAGAGSEQPVNASMFNGWDTTTHAQAIAEQYSEDGLRVVMRLQHPFFAHDAPLLLNPGVLTIEIYLEDPATALTTQAPVPSFDAMQCAPQGPVQRVNITGLWLRTQCWPSLDDPASGYSGVVDLHNHTHYELLSARLHVLTGILSDDFKSAAADRLRSGVSHSIVGYKSVHFDVPPTEIDTTLRFGERTANVRRVIVVPRWLSNLGDMAVDSFAFHACAINNVQWRYRGSYYPAEPLASQDEIYEATASEADADQRGTLRLTRTDMLGARAYLRATNGAAASYSSTPYLYWAAPRAFMLVHSFQDDAAETDSAESATRAEGLSILPTSPLELRIRRATAVASWPNAGTASAEGGFALQYRTNVGASRYLTAQNNRGSLVSGDTVTAVPMADVAFNPLYYRNSAVANDTLRYTMFLDSTIRITQLPGGRILAEI